MLSVSRSSRRCCSEMRMKGRRSRLIDTVARIVGQSVLVELVVAVNVCFGDTRQGMTIHMIALYSK